MYTKEVATGWLGGPEPLMCRIAPDGGWVAVVGMGIDLVISPDGRALAFARALPDSFLR